MDLDVARYAATEAQAAGAARSHGSSRPTAAAVAKLPELDSGSDGRAVGPRAQREVVGEPGAVPDYHLVFDLL